MATSEENKELLDIVTMFTSEDQETVLLAKSLLLTSQFFTNRNINMQSIVKFYNESFFSKKLVGKCHINKEIIEGFDSFTRLEIATIKLFILHCLNYEVKVINS